MSVQLTTKYRPKTFAQVVGQDLIKKALSRAASEDRLAHVYLFSGTRGVGKTTIARILAKVVNCQEAPCAEPCNKCANCLAITKGNSPDVLEIDGASHTGVDNVRKLREDVLMPPFHGRYKVIIIDEAHMLSKAAFNALLKTLEEPPKHCLFIFATTEPEKFPVTIISRSQHYIFNALEQKQISAHLRFILEQEGVTFKPEAVELIAKRANGSIRDGISLLAQILALCPDLNVAQVREVLGLAGEEMFQSLFQAILSQDLLAIHQISEQMRSQGLDLGFFLQEFANYWRNLFLLAQLKEKANTFLKWEQEKLDTWQKLALHFGLKRIHASWQLVLEGQRSILKHPDPVTSLELLLFNLCYLSQLLGIDKLQTDVELPKQTTPKESRVETSLATYGSQPNKLVTEKNLHEPKKQEPKTTIKTLKDEFKSHPVVKTLMNEFGARILSVDKR